MALFLVYNVTAVFNLILMLFFMRLKFSIPKSLCFAVPGTLFIFALNYIKFVSETIYINGTLITLVQVILTQFLFWFLSDYRDFRAVFTGVTAATLNVYAVVIGAFLIDAHELAVLGVIMSFVVMTVITVWLFVQIREIYLAVLDEFTNEWGLLWLLPATVYIAEYTLVEWPQNFADNPLGVTTAAMLLLLLLSALALIFRVIYDLIRESERNEQITLVKSYADALEDTLEMESVHEEETRILRHDMKHILDLIEHYNREGRTYEISKLCADVTRDIDNTKDVRYCENSAVNAIINKYAVMASESGIEFTCRANVKNDPPFEAYEIAVVIANMLSNALRETSKCFDEDKVVDFTIDTLWDKIIIESINTFEGKLKVDKKTGLPLSKRGSGHGFGMKSIKAFADYYGGLFDFGVENKKFYIRVMIPVDTK